MATAIKPITFGRVAADWWLAHMFESGDKRFDDKLRSLGVFIQSEIDKLLLTTSFVEFSVETDWFARGIRLVGLNKDRRETYRMRVYRNLNSITAARVNPLGQSQLVTHLGEYVVDPATRQGVWTYSGRTEE